MTPAQKVMLMIDLPAKNGRRASVSLFTQAALIQGWKKSDRDLRLKVFSLAVSFPKFQDVLEFRSALENYDTIRAHPPGGIRFRHLISASELDNREDVDRVKNLLLMLADNLKATNEHGKPEHAAARRWRDVLADHMKCLALYPLDAPMGAAGAEAYVQAIINDKFNRNRRFQTMTIADVDESPRFVQNERTGDLEEKVSNMEQLLFTVNARLNGKDGLRATAKHSMHKMKTSAKIPCWCTACKPRRPLLAALPKPKEELEPF